MRYASHTATRIHKEVFERWYIGKEARERRLHAVREEMERGGLGIESLLKAKRSLQERMDILSRVLRQIATIIELAAAEARFEAARAQYEEVERQIASIDTSSFEAVKAQMAALADSLRACELEIGTLQGRIGSAREREMSLGVKLEGEQAEGGRREAALAGFVAGNIDKEAELAAYFDERMKSERRQTGGGVDFADMIRRYESSNTGLATRLEKARTDLRLSKQRYNHDWNEVLGQEDDESREHRERLVRYRETELPEYRDRISRARVEAERQFREHFVSRLNEYLMDAEEGFREINHILEAIRFGKDQYHFSITRNPEKQKLLSAISSAAEISELDGTLFASLKSDDERESIERLFQNVLDHELDDPAVREICDYRQYFLYDIRIRHTDVLDDKTGKPLESYLSRVLREKSGGETQTPYYVAIAASFFRFYKDSPGAIRLVLFDEAFNKMDDERIGNMVAFFRKLAMQVVTAVPTEKIESIAPYVDRTNLVIRRNYQAFVRDYAILNQAGS